MSGNSNDVDSGLGALIGIFFLFMIFLYVIVYVLVPLAITIAGVGSVCGGGHAVNNYYKAFRNNVGQSQEISNE